MTAGLCVGFFVYHVQALCHVDGIKMSAFDGLLSMLAQDYYKNHYRKHATSKMCMTKIHINCDAGLVNPAAVELQPYGWLLIVMHYKGCFGSDCLLQVCSLLLCIPCLYMYLNALIHYLKEPFKHTLHKLMISMLMRKHLQGAFGMPMHRQQQSAKALLLSPTAA